MLNFSYLLSSNSLKTESLKIIDVSTTCPGNATPIYQSVLMMQGDQTRIIGLSPLEEECYHLNLLHGDTHLFLSCLIADGLQQSFYTCNFNQFSSIYEPNANLLSKYQDIKELFRIVNQCTMPTHRLDDIEQIQGADLLSIGTHGAQAAILNNATNVLSDILVVHTKVEFVPLYTDQLIFAEIDQILRQHGFLFHKFVCPKSNAINHTDFPKLPDNILCRKQRLYADAIYVKNFTNYKNSEPEKLLKIAFLMHSIYNAYDFSLYALKHYDMQKNSRLASQYLQFFNAINTNSNDKVQISDFPSISPDQDIAGLSQNSVIRDLNQDINLQTPKILISCTHCNTSLYITKRGNWVCPSCNNTFHY